MAPPRRRTSRRSPALFALVMAGGSGTRFWPASREALPKQFLKLLGARTLLEETVRRLRGLVPLERTLVGTGEAHGERVRALLPGLPRENILLEPAGRNTAPCIGLAALHVKSREPEGVLAAMPSDHFVAEAPPFRRALRAGALAAAAEDLLVTVGLSPTRPETGYGYIRKGASLGARGGQEVFAVSRFTEKPDRACARRYLRSGRYLWNAGIFVARAERFLQEIGRHLPALSRELERIARVLGSAREREGLRRAFARIAPVSFDYGVMERAQRVAVVPARVRWSDVGSWSALRDPALGGLDGEGNLWLLPAGSRREAAGTRRTIVASSKPLVVALGVSDLVVVEAEDVLLLCHAERAQQVGDVVRALRAKGLRRFL
ncbi:MAG: mannose-1-phosphate guanylyltransferase [Nitrospinota bacterium]